MSDSENPPAEDQGIPQPQGEQQLTQILTIPTLAFYVKLYANSFSGNDKKAMAIFKQYESREKISRLRVEVYSISQGRVPDHVCAGVLGKVRKARFDGFPKWARMMLGLLASGGQ
jgi:hypothetical protein